MHAGHATLISARDRLIFPDTREKSSGPQVTYNNVIHDDYRTTRLLILLLIILLEISQSLLFTGPHDFLLYYSPNFSKRCIHIIRCTLLSRRAQVYYSIFPDKMLMSCQNASS